MRTLSPPPPAPPLREDSGAEDRRHFRRNLIGVGVAHALILLVLFLAGILHSKPKPVEVLWLDGSSLGESESTAAEPDAAPEMDEPIPEPAPPPVNQEPASEIVEPKATPAPATPKPATPKPATPKPTTPKPATPKATPAEKRKATPAASPKPKSAASPKPAGTAVAKKKDGEKSGDKNAATGTKPGAAGSTGGDSGGKGKSGAGTGGGISQFGWYTDMLHDRYYSRWEQPVG